MSIKHNITIVLPIDIMLNKNTNIFELLIHLNFNIVCKTNSSFD